MRGATKGPTWPGYLYEFQSTRPCGARRATGPGVGDTGVTFQSTRPCGARRCHPGCKGRFRCRFNPRARAGRDFECPTMPEPLDSVSIHAPVRGATIRKFNKDAGKGMGFNPRARAGRDLPGQHQKYQCGRVSIHAPVRGATRRCARRRAHRGRFNPRARAGRDLRERAWWVMREMFQSTRPCGARREQPDAVPTQGTGFNPRARAGRDQKPLPARCASMFQSTRPCGARLHRQCRRAHGQMFQSTRPCGARPATS